MSSTDPAAETPSPAEAKGPILLEFGEEKPDLSAPAPSRFLAKSPQTLGNF
jgi:hypothetical protein